MRNPYEELFKMMNLPMEFSIKFYEVIEKGTKAVNSMAKAQKDMEDFQKAWKELQDLNPLLKSK
ncbi:MAG: hypothetical protein ACRENZ_07860 [Thermodesulfobacteriota bacterium]